MRTTLNIDDELLELPSRMTGLKEKTTFVRLGLEALIARESAKRLAKLGGRGLGYVDMHLLAAALLSGAPLWTLDKQLDKSAAGLHCRYESDS